MLEERIGLQLKEIRIGLRMSQAEFAAKMNVAQTTMSKYEAGKSTPDCVFLYRLHDLYGVDIGRLVTGESQTPSKTSSSEALLDEGVLLQVIGFAVESRWIKVLTRKMPDLMKELTETYEFLYWKKHKR